LLKDTTIKFFSKIITRIFNSETENIDTIIVDATDHRIKSSCEDYDKESSKEAYENSDQKIGAY